MEQIMTKKILCATDGEPHSDIPVARAIEMAAELGAKLAIIAVNIRATDGRGSNFHLWTDEKLNCAVEHAAEVAKKAGMPAVEKVKAFGRDPATVVVNYAASNGYDHIVVGSPRVGIARLVLGSVAAEIAAKAHCPVTVAR
jgi:nucleotide-binding universal stress UspA family protein